MRNYTENRGKMLGTRDRRSPNRHQTFQNVRPFVTSKHSINKPPFEQPLSGEGAEIQMGGIE